MATKEKNKLGGLVGGKEKKVHVFSEPGYLKIFLPGVLHHR